MVIRFCKITWLLFWASLMSVVLFVPMTLAALLSFTGNLAFPIAKIWARVMLLVTCVKTTLIGGEKIEKGKSYIIILNHQSNFDILALVTALGMQFRWVIKREILKVPLFGYALYASRNIFVDRSNREKAQKSIQANLNTSYPDQAS